jgi:hypothetical protein
VPALQEQAATVFRSALFKAASAAALHRRNGTSDATTEHRLKPAALADIVDEVYNGAAAELPNARPLRDVVCHVVSIDVDALMCEPRFVELLESNVVLAADAAKALALSLRFGYKPYTCPKCYKLTCLALGNDSLSERCLSCSHSTTAKEWEKVRVLPNFDAKWQQRQRLNKSA